MKKSKISSTLLRTLAFALSLSVVQATQAGHSFQNMKEIKSSLNFSSYYSRKPVKKLKVAVFDKGFDGYKGEIGKSLPSGTVYHAGPIEAPPEIKVVHGLVMAQILTSLMTNDGQASQFTPEFHLYNVYGYTNFKAAITDVIAKKFDLVLYSEVWELGGNSDGKGFINTEVNRATSAGIIWVNAAGNFNTRTYRGGIKTLDDDWVELPDRNQSLSFRCEKSKCNVRVVLSWNDFKDNSDEGTDKDLDFALTDDLLNIVQTSALKQSADKNENRPGFSKYPREAVQAEVEPGVYYIRVKNRSKNFKSSDQLRIVIDGDSIKSESAKAQDTILNPADNPTVVTVGASDSDRSSFSKKLGKPDVTAPSSIKLENKEEFRGSSNSAAIVAAGLALMKSLNPHWDRAKLLKAVINAASENRTERPAGLSIQQLGFWPTSMGCFAEVQAPTNLEAHMKKVLGLGGKFVATSSGFRIMVNFDPIQLNSSLKRNLANDIIVATPQGYVVVSRYDRRPFPPNWVEVFQEPMDAPLCVRNWPQASQGPSFRLP